MMFMNHARIATYVASYADLCAVESDKKYCQKGRNASITEKALKDYILVKTINKQLNSSSGHVILSYALLYRNIKNVWSLILVADGGADPTTQRRLPDFGAFAAHVWS
jgi:hypothetical protein